MNTSPIDWVFAHRHAPVRVLFDPSSESAVNAIRLKKYPHCVFSEPKDRLLTDSEAECIVRTYLEQIFIWLRGRQPSAGSRKHAPGCFQQG